MNCKKSKAKKSKVLLAVLLATGSLLIASCGSKNDSGSSDSSCSGSVCH